MIVDLTQNKLSKQLTTPDSMKLFSVMLKWDCPTIRKLTKMIVDLTQNRCAKDMNLGVFFSDSFTIAKALVLARSILPRWYYEDIKKELIGFHPGSARLALLLQ